jgi:hypothetical protein
MTDDLESGNLLDEFPVQRKQAPDGVRGNAGPKAAHEKWKKLKKWKKWKK